MINCNHCAKYEKEIEIQDKAITKMAKVIYKLELNLCKDEENQDFCPYSEIDCLGYNCGSKECIAAIAKFFMKEG